MTRKPPTLRERQRLETRRLIQTQAMRLFLARGYDETTVNDVAEAARVSAMTVYRHFPTKEDLVLSDEYNAIIAERIAARPPHETLVQRIGRTFVEDIGLMVGGGSHERAAEGVRARLVVPGGKELLLARLKLVMATPALRARQWESQYAIQRTIVEALRGDPPDRDLEFQLWVASGACCAALRAALFRWAEENGRPDLTRLLEDALAIAFAGQFP
ncbi:TetR/AcrR family transcriptional regulator [Pendulispora albinea]|uniref:TetR/AcrR family transcriptional regulator n=1 Tax=Pendulispora albinea TaxID=2741071 RepID=A0ABZ2MBV2_9BACT